MSHTKFDINDFGWSWQLQNSMMFDAVPIDVDWQRTGTTGSKHELGPGHVFIIAQVYSNGTFRQLVDKDGVWWDCLMIRDDLGVRVLEKRIVNSAKVAHVAASYGITLQWADGTPVPFDGSEKVHKTPAPIKPVEGHKVVGKEYDLAAFEQELAEKYPTCASAVSALLTALSKRWAFWIGEAADKATVYPYFIHNRQEYWPIYIYTTGKVAIPFTYIKNRPPWNDPALLQKFFDLLPDHCCDKPEGKPSFLIGSLEDEEFLHRLLVAIDFFMDTTLEVS